MRIMNLECKRILKAKSTWILLALSLLLSVLLAWLPMAYCYSSYTDEEGNEITLTGRASVFYEKQRQAQAAGTVTPERVRAAVEAYQECLGRYGVTESYDLPQGVYEREILPFAPLLHGVKEAFADPDTGMAPGIMEISPERIDDYYMVCEDRLDALMKMEQPDNPSVQNRAAGMYERVKKPFMVYPGFTTNVMDYQNILGFLVLLFCVVTAAPVFSADYQSGADDILRCAKHGRARLGAVRAAAVLGISAFTCLVCFTVYIFTVDSLFGWDCTRTDLQMMYSIVTLTDMSVGQLQWFFAFAGLLSVLAAVSLTLFLSSVLRNTMASLAAAAAFCMMPVIVSMAVPGTASTWICSLLPASGVSIQASILYAVTDFQFLNLAGMPVWTPYAMVGANILEIPLFLFLAVRSYSRHTVR